LARDSSRTPNPYPDAVRIYVGWLLRDRGYRKIQQVGKAGDLAADLLCFDKEGRSVVVQCKRYGPGYKVTSPEIQMFIGMQRVQHRAERAIFVTTSDFTAPAWKLAHKHGILLVDGQTLMAYIEHANLTRRERVGNNPLIRMAAIGSRAAHALLRVAGLVTRALARKPNIVTSPASLTRPAPKVRITVMPANSKSPNHATPAGLPVAELPPYEVPSQPRL